jgi:antitoxin (DNA-binding transcriptional repressor) of toxin-antitoxin stability system
MRVVGLRELKNRLSEYVRRVRAGEAVLVTDRGEIVAELRPPGHPTLAPDIEPGLLELASRGLVCLGGPNSPDHYPAMPPALRSVTVTALLDAERGDR